MPQWHVLLADVTPVEVQTYSSSATLRIALTKLRSEGRKNPLVVTCEHGAACPHLTGVTAEGVSSHAITGIDSEPNMG